MERGRVPRQRCDFAPLLDAEAPQAVGPPQRGEALVGHAGRPGDELQQAEPLLVVEALYGGPEPAHHDVAVVVTWWGGGRVTGTRSGGATRHVRCNSIQIDYNVFIIINC